MTLDVSCSFYPRQCKGHITKAQGRFLGETRAGGDRMTEARRSAMNFQKIERTIVKAKGEQT